SDVLPGGAPITLQLGTPGRITGVVMSTTTGEPLTSYRLKTELKRGAPSQHALASVTVNLGAFGEEPKVTHDKTISDAEGRFTVEDLAPGTARLEVSADQHAPGGVDGVPVKAGETTKGVIIFLEPEGILEGNVRDAKTKAPLAASVTVNIDAVEDKPAEGGAPWHKITPATERIQQANPEGHFSIAGLPRGSARVHPGLAHDYTPHR